ncbi:hypothetical protein WDU94_007556 [Cyamophila willieti]
MVYKAHPMERRKLLLHIDQEDDQDEVSRGSSVSRLLIECPRVVYTAFCFIIFVTSCLFLLILLVFLLLLNERSAGNVSDNDMMMLNKQKYQSVTTSTKPPPPTTMYRNKQSMLEYLRGLKRTKIKTTSSTKQSKQRYFNKNKNLTETCLNLIRNDDEFAFNNVTINNIFFTKFSNEMLDDKSACCIESAAYLNPYKTVFILNIQDRNPAGTMDKVRETTNNLTNDAKAAPVTHVNYLKSFYKNLKVRGINTDSFLRNTPFENADIGRRDPKLLTKMTELITSMEIFRTGELQTKPATLKLVLQSIHNNAGKNCPLFVILANLFMDVGKAFDQLQSSLQ